MTTETLFKDLPLHPMMAAALARKGYEVAMPVQAAVMAPELAERDLLVSSQTGSGKTIAFGLAMAPVLLDMPAPKSERGLVQPWVLVVAPTRELAGQVSTELAWLYGDSPVRLESFTGGTNVGVDVRRLRMGVDVVVGTPGRLVDLLTRGSLDLSAIAALVLDEADEMLDMGFKEDLEALLNASPKTRRTFLFSATIPSGIARLAAAYQNKAARVDMRPAGGAKGHSDINFVGYVVNLKDRFAAVVNALLSTGDAKTIIFCRTREGVGELQHKLVAHGFSAVAMAGDRAQGERDRALGALRSGAARILVATNVAARGIDVPDVEIVIHGDLPDGIESLTHRSGRTGRAGRKGTCIVLAEPIKRRRAERMFYEAGIKCQWTTPVTKSAAQRAAEDGVAERLMDLLGVAPEAEVDGDAEVAPLQTRLGAQTGSLVDRLLALVPERALLDLLLSREMERMPAALAVDVPYLDAPQRRTRGDFEGPSNLLPLAHPRAPAPVRAAPPVRDAAPARIEPVARPRATERFVPPHADAFPEAFEDAPAPKPTLSPKPALAAKPVAPRPPAPAPTAIRIQAKPVDAEVESGTPRSRTPAAPAKIERVRAPAPAPRALLEHPREQSFEPSYTGRENRPVVRSSDVRGGGRAVIFRVNMGANEQAEPRILLPIICRRGGIDRTAVGSIRVGPNSSTFEISAESAVAFARAAMRPDANEPNILIEAARPSETEAPSRPGKPAGRPAPAGHRPAAAGGGRTPLPRRIRPGSRPQA